MACLCRALRAPAVAPQLRGRHVFYDACTSATEPSSAHRGGGGWASGAPSAPHHHSRTTRLTRPQVLKLRSGRALPPCRAIPTPPPRGSPMVRPEARPPARLRHRACACTFALRAPFGALRVSPLRIMLAARSELRHGAFPALSPLWNLAHPLLLGTLVRGRCGPLVRPPPLTEL